jgi:Ca2+-binding EF-hand superfamily protein
MSNSTLQALVDSYEDIPAMMHRIHDGNSEKTTRFHPAVAPNQLVQAEQALRGHSKVDSRTADFASMARMARQAKKVMNHISSLPASSASSSTPLGPSSRLKSRSISDSAHIAMQKLESLQKSGVDLSRFYSQYDVHKRGRVSYKDFADTMMHLCSGVNKQDLYSVAAAVDAQKTGSVSYDNLLSSLKAVRDTVKYQSLPSNPSSSHPNTKSASAFARVEVVPPPKAVIDVVPLSDALQPCLSAPYDYETGQSKSERRRAAAIQESCFERIFHPTCPFHVDSQSPTVERGRMKTEGTAKRARSAPPRAERTSFYREHFRHDRLPVASSSELEPGQVPLRTFLSDMRERTYASRLGLVSESDADPTAISSATAPVKATEHAAAMDKKNREAQGRVWNRLLQESKANIPVLKHLLRQHDLSNSGKVSTEEFRQALHKAGVALTDSEQQQLVVQLGARANTATANTAITVPSSEGEGSGEGGTKSHRSLQSSSVHSVIASNAPRDGDGSVIDIDGFLDALSARASSASYQHVLSSSTNTKNQFSNNNPPQRKEQGMHSVTEREEGRVARKVLESWQRHSNPAILLQDALQQVRESCCQLCVLWFLCY